MELDPKIQLRQELRSQLLNRRRSLPIKTWQQQSQKICDRLSELDLIKNAEIILGFISFRQEPDLSYLYQKFPNKTWGFPRCDRQKLEWYQVNPLNFSESFKVGNFGILEPIPTLPKIDLTSIDAILVPAIAIDDRGYRLGYGGGFYDRFLIEREEFSMGVVFAEFFLNTIPIQPWDLPVKSVCTENGIYAAN